MLRDALSEESYSMNLETWVSDPTETDLLCEMFSSLCTSKFPHQVLPCLLTSLRKIFWHKAFTNHTKDQIIAIVPRK